MAATNKCLAQSNKSRHVSRATKDTNGHRPSEQPRGHARSGLRRAHGAPSVPPDSSGEADAMSFLAKKG